MNNELSNLMSGYFKPEFQISDNDRGGSSMDYTKKLRNELPGLLNKYSIQSIFDAGCNDCSWMSTLIDNLDYYGGDVSINMIVDLQQRHPELKVLHHDATTDPFPPVDLLFIRDVTIHLNYTDKKKVIENWLSSKIPWILVTHDDDENTNLDFDYADGFPWAQVNWEKDPWNFPKPTDVIYEIGTYGRCMALWHRDQICQLPV